MPGVGTIPGMSAIVNSVQGGLRVDTGLTGALVPSITFEPTMAMSAKRIDLLGLSLRSFREPLKRAIQQVLAPSFQKNFDVGGRPDPWEPLSEATLAVRSSLGYGEGDILIRTGLLRKTIGQLNVWDINATTALLRNVPEKIWYGKIHQAGYEGRSMKAALKRSGGDAVAALRDVVASAGTGSYGASPIPARPFVLAQEEDYDAIEKVFIKWLDEKISLYWAPVIGS